jgi:hypothetical protein
LAAKPDSYIQFNKEIVRNIFKQKEKYHLAQARLPIEEKVKILVELQKMALTVRPKQGEDDKRIVWQIK